MHYLATTSLCISFSPCAFQNSYLCSWHHTLRRAIILSHLAAVHAHGLRLSLRNIIKVGSGYRLIDLEHATAHSPEKCLWSLAFLNPGEYDYFDKAQQMRCLELQVIAEDMMF